MPAAIAGYDVGHDVGHAVRYAVGHDVGYAVRYAVGYDVRYDVGYGVEDYWPRHWQRLECSMPPVLDVIGSRHRVAEGE